MNYYIEVLKKYAVFNGRSTRKEFWMFVLINLIVMLILGVIDSAAGLTSESGNGVLGSIYWLAVLVPSIAVAIRRLHDIGRSGWYLLLGFIPLVGIIILIVYYATDSQPGTNQYGPNPKGDNPPTGAMPTPPATPTPTA